MVAISFLGAGAMGRRVIQHLVKAGHAVTVFNRTASKLDELKALGVTTAETPELAAQGADVVFSMVRDDEASKAIWLGAAGALKALKPGAVAVELSTLSPAWVKELALSFKTTDHSFLEAPVLGTLPQAEQGTLIYLVGGAADTLEAVQPLLELSGSAIHPIGEHGQAAAMKLAVNTQFAAQVTIWAETLVLLSEQGIAKNQAVELLATLPTTAPALKVGGQLIAAENYTPLFPIDLVEKDLAYTQQVGKAAGQSLPLIEAVHSLFKQAKEAGYAEDNIVGIAQLYR